MHLSQETLQLDNKLSAGRSTRRHADLEKAVSDASLTRTSSLLSQSSIDSNQSVESSSSAKWSPRTTGTVQRQAKVRGKKSRARAGIEHFAALSPEGSAQSLDLLTEKPSEFIAAARSVTTDVQQLSNRTSHSSLLSPQRSGSASLQPQHSILDPLPEKATDVVRQRKVFGSTYSVGKLGELPYTPLPHARASLTQPPWVAAAARQAATDAIQRQHASTLTHRHSNQSDTVNIPPASNAGPPADSSEPRPGLAGVGINSGTQCS